MNGYDLVPARRSAVVFSELSDCIDAIARLVIAPAASLTPTTTLSERLREEWMADLSDRPGRMARLRLAFGCYWAAILIKHDCCAATSPATSSSTGDRIVITDVRHGMSFFSRQTAAAESDPALYEINTTPLIDILLVLLVTLIVSLPTMTHAVKLDLPKPSPPSDNVPPEVINLDIDFDGAVVWNGAPITDFAQLEGYFRTESHKYPQPEVHLRPDSHAKYDVVAKVLAAAQRNGIEKVGFVNNGEFAH